MPLFLLLCFNHTFKCFVIVWCVDIASKLTKSQRASLMNQVRAVPFKRVGGGGGLKGTGGGTEF